MSKRRILWVSEASFLGTGFSVLTYEILSRLFNTGKYEIAELGSYAGSNDPRAFSLPWDFYGSIPDENDDLSQQRYNGSVYGQFGEAVFEKVCLEFKPDIVVDVRDDWMCAWQLDSPFRKYFKLVWMPTVDGEPQRLEWLDHYSRADHILTYSHYGKQVLEREAPGKIKVVDVVSPGVNHEMFVPAVDKKRVRWEMGVKTDANIIMSVMRNQRRKLFPDLIEMFKEYLMYCVKHGRKDLANNTYLYLHTSYPDVGFDISKHILNNGVGHRVYVTYLCDNCKHFYSDFFQSELTVCPRCSAIASHMPNTQYGLSREGVAKVLSMADAYVQYSICEGFGMPIAEAKACGVPSFGVDYSATAEQVNVPGSQPIEVEKFFYESVTETEQKRALPNNQDAVKKLFKFFTLPDLEKKRWSELSRKDASENHTFERSTKIFESLFDNMDILDRSKTWDSHEASLAPNKQAPSEFRSPAELVDWCIDNILGKPELKQTYWRSDLIKSLNVGFLVIKGVRDTRQNFGPQEAIHMFMGMAAAQNYWEKARLSFMDKSSESIRWEMV